MYPKTSVLVPCDLALTLTEERGVSVGSGRLLPVTVKNADKKGASSDFKM